MVSHGDSGKNLLEHNDLQQNRYRNSQSPIRPPSDEQSLSPIRAFTPALWKAGILIASGLFHLAMLAWLGGDWHGPLSLRKPGLFGVSAGLTVWSLAWLLTQLKPRRHDQLLAHGMAWALLIEVGLITCQYWRGVSSHFNRTTPLDASIETAMLVLILIVTLGIFRLTARTYQLRRTDPSMVIAIQAGMWFLSLSCILGILTTLLGGISLARGESYELWGRAGVLKFPHGVALHAIQFLPIIAWLSHRLYPAGSVRLVRAAVASQVAILAYAIRQTFQGRDRFDWDALGGIILGIAVVLGVLPAMAIIKALVHRVKRKSPIV
jgi:hypothetical protein